MWGSCCEIKRRGLLSLFLHLIALIGEYLTSMIGQKAVVFSPFSPAVQLKIEAIVTFSLIESVLCLKQASDFPPFYLRLSLFKVQIKLVCLIQEVKRDHFLLEQYVTTASSIWLNVGLLTSLTQCC